MIVYGCHANRYRYYETNRSNSNGNSKDRIKSTFEGNSCSYNTLLSKFKGQVHIAFPIVFINGAVLFIVSRGDSMLLTTIVDSYS